MAQQLFLVEDIVAHAGEEFLLLGYVILEDEEPKFILHMEMRERSPKTDTPFMSVDIHYSVENPLIEEGIAIGAVSAYASCLAYAGFKFGVKAIKRCYAESKKIILRWIRLNEPEKLPTVLRRKAKARRTQSPTHFWTAFRSRSYLMEMILEQQYLPLRSVLRGR